MEVPASSLPCQTVQVFNGLAAFCTVLLFFGTFVCCCLTAISRIEQWERLG